MLKLRWRSAMTWERRRRVGGEAVGEIQKVK